MFEAFFNRALLASLSRSPFAREFISAWNTVNGQRGETTRGTEKVERSGLRAAASVYNALNRGNSNCNLQVSYFVIGRLFLPLSGVSLHHRCTWLYANFTCPIIYAHLRTRRASATYVTTLKYNLANELERRLFKTVPKWRLLNYILQRFSMSVSHWKNNCYNFRGICSSETSGIKSLTFFTDSLPRLFFHALPSTWKQHLCFPFHSIYKVSSASRPVSSTDRHDLRFNGICKGREKGQDAP